MKRLILFCIISVFVVGVIAHASYEIDRKLKTLVVKMTTETQIHTAALKRAKNPEEIVAEINAFTKRMKPLILKVVEIKKRYPHLKPSRHLERIAVAFEQEFVKMGKVIGYIRLKYPSNNKIREAFNRMIKELEMAIPSSLNAENDREEGIGSYEEKAEEAGFVEDCISYNPHNLRIRYVLAKGWLLTDGRKRLYMLASKEDALKALAVAKRHTKLCFIGRDSREPNRRYIEQYWEGNSGISTTIDNEDCYHYDRKKLIIQKQGSTWVLTDGFAWMARLYNKADALKILEIARRHRCRCHIGRNNKIQKRIRYILDYWK